MKKTVLWLILAALLICGCRKTDPAGAADIGQTLPAETAAFAETSICEETTPATQPTPVPQPEEFVRVLDHIPGAYQELMYATDRNFTGQIIYDFADVYLRYGTVQKLAAVCKDLGEMGLSVKIWDGFRPVSAQYRLWEVYPDPAFVADPNKGFSSHSRGNTVDLTLVDLEGNELEMPTGFDDFSSKADRDYGDCTSIAADHAELLEILMEKHGFVGYAQEWWHYSDEDAYPVEEHFSPRDKN